MKRCIVFLGKTGSGKGTQLDILAQKMPLKILHTGELLRAESEENPDLKARMNSGQLVEPSTVNQVAEKFMRANSEASLVVCDGYPRLKEELEALDTMLEAQDRELALVVHIVLPDSEIHQRLQIRSRADDTTSAIVEKIEEFEQNSQFILETYKQRGVLVTIDGAQSVAQVSFEIQAAFLKHNILNT